MAKLWDKKYKLNDLIEKFTVGLDYRYDLNLIAADCMGSIAHARGLERSGYLRSEERIQLEEELRNIAAKAMKKKVKIKVENEDSHTTIELNLQKQLGEQGKKIHLGRSRNDQVITSTRLFTKAALLQLRQDLLELVSTFLDFAKRYEKVPMPGRTHMQIAMPSSIGLWAASILSQLLDDYRILMASWDLMDQSPLGSAASYGTPLALDREYTSMLMGFGRVQKNVLAVNNSRGKYDSVLLDAIDQIGITLGKFATDAILFSLPEFGYFSLPAELCSGSSIMPQKQNPDGLELLRGRTASISAYAIQVKNVIRALPSGYNRDYQDTKEPLIRSFFDITQCIRIAKLSIASMKVHEENLKKAFTKEIYATDEAILLTEQGMSFRDAYKEISHKIEEGSYETELSTDDLFEKRVSTGNMGNLLLDDDREFLATLVNNLQFDQSHFNEAQENLLGPKITILPKDLML